LVSELAEVMIEISTLAIFMFLEFKLLNA